MQEYTLDDLCMFDPNLLPSQTTSNFSVNGNESNLSTFLKPEWNIMEQVFKEDCSAYRKKSCMYRTEFEIDSVFRPESLHESNYDTPFVSEDDIIDFLTSQNSPPMENELLARASSIDLAMTGECYQTGHHVNQTGLLQFDQTFGNYHDTFYDDSRARFDSSMSDFVSRDKYVQDTIQNGELQTMTLPNKSEVSGRIINIAKDENFTFIPWKINNNNASFEYNYDLLEPQYISNTQTELKKFHEVGQLGLKRVCAREKDEKYWKRREKNNKAAKKSRAARKNRFILMEERIKELEIENAVKRIYLRNLERSLLQKQGNKIF